MNISAAIALFLIGLGITGCGPGDKWVSTVNEAAGVKISGRYVSSNRSVKVHAVENGVKLDFCLSDSLPRVSRKRIEANLKKLDFGKFVSKKQLFWAEELGKSKSAECTERAQSHYKTLLEIGKKSTQVGITLSQDPSGEITMNIVQLAPERVLGRMRSSVVSAQKKLCITSFKGESDTLVIVREFLAIRQSLIDLLAKESGFDGSRTGSRLSRVSSLAPSETERDKKARRMTDEDEEESDSYGDNEPATHVENWEGKSSNPERTH